MVCGKVGRRHPLQLRARLGGSAGILCLFFAGVAGRFRRGAARGSVAAGARVWAIGWVGAAGMCREVRVCGIVSWPQRVSRAWHGGAACVVGWRVKARWRRRWPRWQRVPLFRTGAHTVCWLCVLLTTVIGESVCIRCWSLVAGGNPPVFGVFCGPSGQSG